MATDFEIDTNNKEFQTALQLVTHTRQSIFLTGKAGTGKSTFLKYICSHTKKKYVVLAPTGIAAINAGGVTLHSFFKLPFRPILPNDPDLTTQKGRIFEFFKYSREHRKILEDVELVIIDEISMVRADIIDCVDRILRVYSKNMRLPFGGKQLLFVGDVFQLEPVVSSDQRDILNRFYPNSYFFSAKVFQEINLVPIELQKVYRQKDALFVSILDHIRSNRVPTSDLQVLNARCFPKFEPQDEELFITLATRRDQVDYINEKKLAELPGDEFVSTGKITGDFPESALPTQLNLAIKEKAQVIFIENDRDRRWVNGTIGTISGIDPQGNVYVLLENGEEYLVEPTQWSNYKYRYNEEEKRIEEEIIGTFTQLPIRLAWAITVHKSQGLTFSRVVVDLTGGVFAGGQTYVALSRCTSLDGLVLKSPISHRDIFVRREVLAFSQQFNNRGLIQKSLEESEAELLYLKAANDFDQRHMTDAVEAFSSALQKRNELQNPLIRRLISQKLTKQQVEADTLKEKIKSLQGELHQLRSTLKEFAYEYFLMGNECITKAHDAQAALRCFDKALKMDPYYVDAWVRKGVTLFDQGDTQSALTCFNQAIQLDRTSFKAFYNRGKTYFKQKYYEEALSDFLSAASLKKDHATTHDYLAELYTLQGDEETAEKHQLIAEKLRILKNKKKRG